MSIVIVKRAEGYVAHLRFTDRTKDIDLSATSHTVIYYLIERYLDNQNS